MDGDVDFFYGLIKKSANIISKNISVLLKHSDRNIGTLHRFACTSFSYLSINFFNTNFIEMKMRIITMATIIGWFLYISIALSTVSQLRG